MNVSYAKQPFKYYPLLVILLITSQLAANILGPRTISIRGILLPGGFISFPLTFFWWDIITEIYGFIRAKQLMIYYIIGQFFFAGLIWICISLPADQNFAYAGLYSFILTKISKITVSMIAGISIGDFVNCYVLSKLKFYTNGKYLWMRLIGSSCIGQLTTTLIVANLFYFNTEHPPMLGFIINQSIMKIGFEILMIIPTYIAINVLKNVEKVDVNRRYLNFASDKTMVTKNVQN